MLSAPTSHNKAKMINIVRHFSCRAGGRARLTFEVVAN